jgi:hypothetical protein
MVRVKRRKIRKNYANRFVVILFVALIVNLGLYWLPDSVLGLQVKKVDLLSDIRIDPEENGDDPLAVLTDDDEADDFADNAENTTLTPETTISESIIQPPVPPDDPAENRPQKAVGNPVVFAQKTDSALPAKTFVDDDKNNTDYLFNTHIEDFSSGHTGLRRFFAALNSINKLGRPVRIAFLGDSFIEGDILVADFRAKMQANFGGRGVGFIPVTSNVAQYRPTIKQSADGWNTYSIVKNKHRKYVLSGLQFEPVSDDASIRFQTVDLYPGLEEVSSIKFFYSTNENTGMLLKSNSDTSYHQLPPTENVTQFEVKGRFTQGTIQFKNATGLNALGFAFEDNRGVVVDNFSLRGNSGIIMSEIDRTSCRELQRIRPYDLIVLQYGLNVASDSVREYGWYRNQMVAVTEHIRDCFPGADILILGVSDRSHKHGGSYSTMPAVLSLLRAQRQTAKKAEVTFWSIFAAMGGQNSMVRYVNSNWASKDYTHLSFRGGSEVAKALFEAIITEKNRYDGDEKLVER